MLTIKEDKGMSCESHIIHVHVPVSGRVDGTLLGNLIGKLNSLFSCEIHWHSCTYVHHPYFYSINITF